MTRINRDHSPRRLSSATRTAITSRGALLTAGFFLGAPAPAIAQVGKPEIIPIIIPNPDAPPANDPAPDQPILAQDETQNAFGIYDAVDAVLGRAGLPARAENPMVDAWLKANRDKYQGMAAELLRATRLPRCDFGVDFNKVEIPAFHVNTMRNMDRILRDNAIRERDAGNLPAVGESLAGRVRVACQLGASRTLVEKRQAVRMLSDALRLIAPYSTEGAEADRLALVEELRKIDPVDPFDFRGGLAQMSKTLLVPVAKQDPALGLDWLLQLTPNDAMNLAQTYQESINDITKAWPDANDDLIRAHEQALNERGTPHILSGIERAHAQAMQLRTDIAEVISLLKNPPKFEDPDLPAQPAAQPAGK
ncbi:MAG TPA: hypothetical protein VG797_01210 [Phycisphaerales bacterium]|nr:hypothetical protein [Phycisphaerales bacterium]